MKNKKGFTLIEILGVIVIIAILAGIVIFSVNRYMKKGKEEFNKSIEKTLVSNAKEYYSENLSELPNGRIDGNAPRYIDVLWASELASKGFYTNEIVDANENDCSTSYVVVEQDQTTKEYTYTPCVICENDGYSNLGEVCNFVHSSDNTPPTCGAFEVIGTMKVNGEDYTNPLINKDRIQLRLKASDTSGIAGYEINGVFISVGDDVNATRYIEYNWSETYQIRVYDKNNNVTTCPLKQNVYIDANVPEVSIKATKKDKGTTVESESWSNEGLNFTLTAGNVGRSGATIYYCKDTTNMCVPETEVTNGTTIKDYNTLTGTYYIRYKIVSGVKKESEIYSYIAKVDTTNPVCKLSVTETGIAFASKTDNVGIKEYGMGTIATALYNSAEKLSLGLGTFYGYVKDEAGNTSNCSAKITSTVVNSYTKTTKTCGYDNLKCWNYSSYECPDGYSYCSWCEVSDCVSNRPTSYTANYGVIASYKEKVPGGDSETWDCNTGYVKTSFDGTYIYCSKYGYYCNSSSHSRDGSTCYYYLYDYYDRWCSYSAVTGEYLSGDYCYLNNQGTSCPYGWEVSDYTTYEFKTSITNTTTCKATSSFTCNSNNYGESYTLCTPAYTCSSGNKLNDMYCYSLK